MIVVPSGRFTMGSSRGEAHHEDDEEPLHRVRIDYRFAVGVYEVTFAEWYACIDAGGCGNYIPDDMHWGRGKRPVINVSWDDAQSYVRWLSARTGKTYRLLSESEWEYVARAGTETAYSWGNSIGVNRANCRGCGSQWDDAKTAPVGSFAANAWGVHDMHGNVREWVQDCWHDNYEGAPTDGSVWGSEEECGRVMRGGSWDYGPWNLRSAGRAGGYTVNYRNEKNGFRVARDL
ncbi:MAG: SUMF1/EgtB/PvdO family nonheme iron enzyme [Gemmatimonadetes bacterium]|nr:SUMF1/EgtB/PvdO family nonheme iron enzyme [Gemmatimonadota bacterium]